MTHPAPEIYVACLSAYAAGKLHGEWIEVDKNLEELEAAIALVIKSSPEVDAEEWAVHDTEGWYGLSIDEHPDLEQLVEWSKLIQEHGAAVSYFIEWALDVGIEPSNDEFELRFCGHWDSSNDFVLKSEEIKEHYSWDEFEKQFPFWSNMIDWEQLASELEMMDAYQYIKASESEGHGIYVFRYM